MNAKFGDKVFRILFVIVFVLGMVGMPSTGAKAQSKVVLPDSQLNYPPEGWILNPANVHYYKLTNNLTWQDAESQAMNWGGHLVTVNNQEETDWLVSTFGGEQSYWIGFTDQSEEGNWVWASGETPAYTNWFQHLCGDWEPNDVGPEGEDYAVFNYNGTSGGCDGIPPDSPEIGPGKWNDIPVDATLRGIVELTAPPPSHIFVEPNEDNVFAWDWPAGVLLTLTIDDPVTTAHYTATLAAPALEDWDHGFFLGGIFDIQPGYVVTVSDGNVAKELTVTHFAVTNIDIDADTVAGVATPGSNIHIGTICDGNGCANRNLIVDSTGNWLVDFSTPVDESWRGMGVFDLRPGSGSSAYEHDEDGDSTKVNWRVPNARLDVFVTQDRIEALDWPLGNIVTLTIDSPGTPQSPDYTTTRTVGPAPWNPNMNAAVFDLNGIFHYQVGDLITVSDGSLTKTHTVMNVAVTRVDPVAETVTGTTDPGAEIEVDIHIDGAPYRKVNADADGQWIVNFAVPWDDQGTYDLTSDINGAARRIDNDADASRADFPHPQIVANVASQWRYIRATDWPLGTLVTLTIDDPSTPEPIDYTAQAIIENPQGSREILANFDLTSVFELKAGDFITMTDGIITKTLTVAQLEVTSADIQADTISGIAVPDAKVQVWCAFPDMCRLISRYVSADGSGNWTANYHIPGTQPDEQQTVDIQGGMAFIASVVDEDGDRTWFDWFVVPNPRFDVWPNGDGIEAWEWPKGDTLTLTIDNPNTAQNPDYTATEIVGDQVAPWNPTVTYVTFGSSGLYDIKLGDVVSISNGTITKTTVVTDLVMTHFDVVADTVSGIAAADSHIDFWVCDSNSSNCIPRHVNADHNGIWFIDLGHFGIENDEQNTLDLVHGTRVYSTQSDEDGDSTRYGEQINNPPQADAGPDQTILEGQTVILNASASSDPDGDALTYEWDFDNDGQFDDATGVAPSVTFADNGTFTVGLRVTDPFGLTSTDTTQVTVANVPPIVNIQHSSVNNLRVFTGDGSFIDPGTDTWTATVNYGDNTGTKNLPLNPDKSFALSHTYTCNGNYTVKVCVKDDDGGSGCNQVQITVKINHPPVAEADGPYFGNEGSSITLSGFKSTDPDYNIVRYEWDLDNDGQFDDATGVKVKFAAIDNGIFTIRLRVTDAGGLSSVDTSTIAVRNVPPVITSITLPTSIRVGTSLNARATFMDAGINDTFTAIWNWGDGSSSNGNVSGYTVTGSHMYSKPGTFTVTITIKDKDGGIGKTYMWIVVKK